LGDVHFRFVHEIRPLEAARSGRVLGVPTDPCGRRTSGQGRGLRSCRRRSDRFAGSVTIVPTTAMIVPPAGTAARHRRNSGISVVRPSRFGNHGRRDHARDHETRV
jgi:hypothetical protein